MTLKVWSNLSGTTAPDFSIGKGGPAIHQGTSAPSNAVGADGDVYIRSGSGAAVYQKDSGSWRALNDTFVRQTIAAGSASATINDQSSYVGIVTGANAVTSVVLPVGVMGKKVTIKDEVGIAASKNITISTNGGSSTIDGQSTYVISTNYGSVTLAWTDAWYVVRKS